jgi:N-sulfoglucosamine sulfohydrolase
LLAGFGTLALAAADAPPNLVVLIADDMSTSTLGCYGDPGIRTPHLDQLARDGMRFTRSYVTSPQCSPSRSSLFTGRTPHAIGTSRLHADLPTGVPTILEPLRARGYFTGMYRKNHLGAEFQKCFDFYGGAGTPFSEFFDRAPAGQPFFLWMGFTDPHRPYSQGMIPRPHDPAKVRVPPFLPDTPEMRADLALHYDAIGRLDDDCGKVLEILRQRGLADNTMVVFFGDNGMPYPRAKSSLYQPGVNTPLIIRWPGKVKPGTVSDELISTVDLPSTWLEAADLAPLRSMEGRSLAKLLTGQPHEPRRYVFTERNWHDTWDPARGIVSARFSLICNYRPEVSYRGPLDHVSDPPWRVMVAEREAGRLRPELESLFRSPRPAVEFYDLAKDPNEFKNLAGDSSSAPELKVMLLALDKWMRDTSDFLPPPATFPQVPTITNVTLEFMLDGPLPKTQPEVPKR